MATQPIWEANVGVELADDLWLDAGIFESHIGYEGAVSAENPVLTRSLAAENSPYYLAGVKLAWQPSEQLTMLLVVANGWQVIRETPDNRNKGIGTQLVWKPTSQIEINWSTFVSDEAPRGTDALWLFSDLYAYVELDALTLLALCDVGLQHNEALDPWDMVDRAPRRAAQPARLAQAPAARRALQRPARRHHRPHRQPCAYTCLPLGRLDRPRLCDQPTFLLRTELRGLRADEPLFGRGAGGARNNLVSTTSRTASF